MANQGPPGRPGGSGGGQPPAHAHSSSAPLGGARMHRYEASDVDPASIFHEQRRPKAVWRAATRLGTHSGGVICVLAILGVASLLLVILVVAPPSIVNPVGTISAAERLAAENAVRGTLLQAAAGLVLGIGLYFTARTLQMNRESQLTGRFSSAIEQLGRDSVDVRMGAIYAWSESRATRVRTTPSSLTSWRRSFPNMLRWRIPQRYPTPPVTSTQRPLTSKRRSQFSPGDLIRSANTIEFACTMSTLRKPMLSTHHSISSTLATRVSTALS